MFIFLYVLWSSVCQSVILRLSELDSVGVLVKHDLLNKKPGVGGRGVGWSVALESALLTNSLESLIQSVPDFESNIFITLGFGLFIIFKSFND